VVAELLQPGHLEPVGFVDDEQLDKWRAAVGIAVSSWVTGIVGADCGQVAAQLLEVLADHPWGGMNGWGVDQGVPVRSILAESKVLLPPGQQGCQLVPAGVLAGRQGLADPRRAVAQADVAIVAARVGELGEAPVLLRDHEHPAVHAAVHGVTPLGTA
jgi:hypothetical protein